MAKIIINGGGGPKTTYILQTTDRQHCKNGFFLLSESQNVEI